MDFHSLKSKQDTSRTRDKNVNLSLFYIKRVRVITKDIFERETMVETSGHLPSFFSFIPSVFLVGKLFAAANSEMM